MNNEEAIALLKKATLFEPKLENKDYPEAFELAIKALEEARPKGKWTKRNGYTYDFKCSCCEYIIYEYQAGKNNFCPNCGASMSEGE